MQLLYDNINNYSNEFYINAYKNLKQIDQAKIKKLNNINRKKSGILSKHLLKQLLKRNNINYLDTTITFNKYHKPLLDNIYFNISHSFEYIACVVSKQPIGVDVEKIRKINLNTLDFFCTSKEKEYILNSEDIYQSLFTIYCLKEAYFKMLGTDLANILNVEFVLYKNHIECSEDKNLNIKLTYNIPGYVLAIIEKKN